MDDDTLTDEQLAEYVRFAERDQDSSVNRARVIRLASELRVARTRLAAVEKALNATELDGSRFSNVSDARVVLARIALGVNGG